MIYRVFYSTFKKNARSRNIRADRKSTPPYKMCKPSNCRRKPRLENTCWASAVFSPAEHGDDPLPSPWLRSQIFLLIRACAGTRTSRIHTIAKWNRGRRWRRVCQRDRFDAGGKHGNRWPCMKARMKIKIAHGDGYYDGSYDTGGWVSKRGGRCDNGEWIQSHGSREHKIIPLHRVHLKHAAAKGTELVRNWPQVARSNVWRRLRKRWNVRRRNYVDSSSGYSRESHVRNQ